MQVLPYYIAIGMPTSEFWSGDPYLVRAYQKAHQLRLEQRNQELWVQGLYNFRGFRSVIEGFAYALSGSKGTKPSEYPSEPIPFTEAEQKAATERNKQRTLKWVQDNQR